MKKILFLCGIISLFLIILFTGCAMAAADNVQASSAKKDPWNYSQEITIKENAGRILTDYQVPVVLNSSNFDFSKVKNDGSDIRFFSGDKILNYWVETWDFKNNQALIWVKIPFISAREDTKITLKCGNPDARDRSSGKDTFDFFDSFDGNSINELDWSIEKAGGGAIEVRNGNCNILAPAVHAYDSSMIYSKENFDIDSIFVVKRMKVTTGDDEKGPILRQGFIDEVDVSKNEIRHETGLAAESQVGWETINRKKEERTSDLTDVGVPEGEWYTSAVAWYKSDNNTRQLAWLKNGVRDAKMDYAGNPVPDSSMHVYLYAASSPSLENTGYMAVDYAFVRKFVETEPTVTISSAVLSGAGLENFSKDTFGVGSNEILGSGKTSEPETVSTPEVTPDTEAVPEPSDSDVPSQTEKSSRGEQAPAPNVSFPKYTVNISGIELSSPYQYNSSALVNELDSSGINTIFLSVNSTDVWQYERFVKTMHENRIFVHAVVLKDLNCNLTGSFNACQETLNTVLDYNKKSLAPFDGIDIYVQGPVKSGSEDNSDYKSLFETANQNLAENVSLSANLPYNSGAPLIEEAAPLVDFYIVRAYDSNIEKSGSDNLNSVPSIVDAVAPQMGEIRGAGSRGIIEISTNEDFEDKISIQELFAELTNYYSGDPTFMGVAVYDYDNYTALPVKSESDKKGPQLPGFSSFSALLSIFGVFSFLRIRRNGKVRK